MKDARIGGTGMKRMIMTIVAIVAIAGVAITAICMPEDIY